MSAEQYLLNYLVKRRINILQHLPPPITPKGDQGDDKGKEKGGESKGGKKPPKGKQKASPSDKADKKGKAAGGKEAKQSAQPADEPKAEDNKAAQKPPQPLEVVIGNTMAVEQFKNVLKARFFNCHL